MICVMEELGLRLKQILVNHEISNESVANPGYIKININVMSI